MEAFIAPPRRIPLLLRAGIWFAEKVTGRVMLPARILAWYPRAALGSGVLEGLAVHADGVVDERMLKLVRMTASFAAACPFCIDMNSYEYPALGITAEEVRAVRGEAQVESVASLTERERLAIRYARAVSQTPLRFTPELIEAVKARFDEREMVLLAATAAQVNYWARLIQALGIPPAGFTQPED